MFGKCQKPVKQVGPTASFYVKRRSKKSSFLVLISCRFVTTLFAFYNSDCENPWMTTRASFYSTRDTLMQGIFFAQPLHLIFTALSPKILSSSTQKSAQYLIPQPLLWSSFKHPFVSFSAQNQKDWLSSRTHILLCTHSYFSAPTATTEAFTQPQPSAFCRLFS